MKAFFTALIYQPILNLFIGLYFLVPDMGVVIILVTILIKVVLYPLTSSSIKAQRSLTVVQPKLDALKKEHKDDQQKLAQETMRVYKEHKINPLSSCLPILIQLPVFIALYWVLQEVLKSNEFATLLYPFIKNPGAIKTVSLGLLDLSKPSIILAILAGLSQYWQARSMLSKKPAQAAPSTDKKDGPDMASMMNKQMLYFMPILTVVIGWTLPAGLTLYWFFSTVLTALQQEIILKQHPLPDSSKPNNVIDGKIIS